METHWLELSFVDDKNSALRHAPIAQVCVKTESRTTADGPLSLTPECVSFREFEVWVDKLKEELDAIKSKARKKFAAEDARFAH